MESIKISLIPLLSDSLKFRQLVKSDPRVSNLTCRASLLRRRLLLEASQEIKMHFRHQTLSNVLVFFFVFFLKPKTINT